LGWQLCWQKKRLIMVQRMFYSWWLCWQQLRSITVHRASNMMLFLKSPPTHSLLHSMNDAMVKIKSWHSWALQLDLDMDQGGRQGLSRMASMTSMRPILVEECCCVQSCWVQFTLKFKPGRWWKCQQWFVWTWLDHPFWCWLV
jgi:hypothetical protein